MTLQQRIIKLLVPNLSIGDLVRLNEDTELSIGVGLVADLKFNFDDVYDLKYILEHLEDESYGLNIYHRDDGFYPTKPQALVMWSGKKLSKSNTMWMYTSEITIVNKVKKVETYETK